MGDDAMISEEQLTAIEAEAREQIDHHMSAAGDHALRMQRHITPLIAEVRRLRDLPADVPATTTWYAITIDGIEECADEADARQAASLSIDHALSDSWHEGVENTEWGRLVPYQRAVQTDYEETPGGENDYTCNYVLHDVRELIANVDRTHPRPVPSDGAESSAIQAIALIAEGEKLRADAAIAERDELRERIGEMVDAGQCTALNAQYLTEKARADTAERERDEAREFARERNERLIEVRAERDAANLAQYAAEARLAALVAEWDDELPEDLSAAARAHDERVAAEALAELRIASECVELAAEAIANPDGDERAEAIVLFWTRRAALGHAGHARAEREDAAIATAREEGRAEGAASMLEEAVKVCEEGSLSAVRALRDGAREVSVDDLEAAITVCDGLAARIRALTTKPTKAEAVPHPGCKRCGEPRDLEGSTRELCALCAENDDTKGDK